MPSGHLAAVRCLLDAGADLEVRDLMGLKAMDCAQLAGTLASTPHIPKLTEDIGTGRDRALREGQIEME